MDVAIPSAVHCRTRFMEFSFIFRNGLVNYAQGKPEDVARLAVIMHVTPNGVILEVEVEDGGIGVEMGRPPSRSRMAARILP